MVQKLKAFSLLLFYVVLNTFFVACGDDDSGGGVTPIPDPDPVPNVEAEDENVFVWKALNSWYYFLDDVANLNDSKDDNENTFNTYLNTFNTPEALFQSLIIDEFSYITDDYEQLGSSLSAIYDEFGFDYGLVLLNDDVTVLGYVRYVFDDSPAADAGLERGDLFLQVNGTTLTRNNYTDLLFDEDEFDLTMADITEQEDGGKTISLTDEVITVTNADYQKTPIWVSKVIDKGTQKIGYLHYSNFASNFHGELNAVFADFKAQGITDLVLDLRYNPGGSVLTAIYLNSMIHSTDTNKLMGSLQYNRKHQDANGNLYFENQLSLRDEDFEEIGTEAINTVNLNRLVVITSRSTASASEFVINALRPYMDVIIVGEQTVGKNLGSISLFDNPAEDWTEKEGANTSHTYGMQPIVSKLFNSSNQSDYDNGFAPDVEISEIAYLGEFKPLGDESEQLLAMALAQICPTCSFTPELTKVDVGQKYVISEKNAQYRNYQILDITGLQ